MTKSSDSSQTGMKIFFPCAILTLLLNAFALAQELGCRLSDAGKLPPEKQEKFDARLRSTPDQAAVRYSLAMNYAQLGNTRLALDELERALSKTPWLDPTEESVFVPLRDCDAFNKIVSRVEQKYPPISASRIVHRFRFATSYQRASPLIRPTTRFTSAASTTEKFLRSLPPEQFPTSSPQARTAFSQCLA
jgi:hypothetical protein